MNHELSHSQHPEEQLTSKNPEVADGDMNFHQALNLLREYAAQEQNFDRAEALNAYIEAANEENPDGRAEAMTSLLKYVSEEKIKLGNTETDGSAEQKMVGLEKIKIALEVERENVEKNTPEQLDQRRAAMELAAAEEKANADKKAEAARREIDTIHNNSDPKKEQLQETNKNEGLPSRLDFNKKADEVARMRFGKTIGGDLGISYDEIINFPDRAKAERALKDINELLEQTLNSPSIVPIDKFLQILNGLKPKEESKGNTTSGDSSTSSLEKAA